MENEKFLNEQILTYLGNKRSLLNHIEKHVINIKKKLNKNKLSCVDLFSGSGIVARMLKQHSDVLITNDMEEYSLVVNECYLTNRSDFNEKKYEEIFNSLKSFLNKNMYPGIICNNYAPLDENNITKNDRVFYTRKNAIMIDSARKFIDTIDDDYKKYFLAPLLYEASVHCNTSGVFKGFYKSKTSGIGKYGGDGENALSRIKGDIVINRPVFSNYECDVINLIGDSNKIIKNIPFTDVVYIDTPYNQHPYGSNYFMLNTIIKNKIDSDISKVSGIPKEWNRSDYNKKSKIMDVFNDLIKYTNAHYIIISYNSDGFIGYDDMVDMLSKYGEVNIDEIIYPTFRGSRNLQNRDKHVTEYLFILNKC